MSTDVDDADKAISEMQTEAPQGGWARLMRRARREAAVPSFAFLPEPRMFGRAERGRQLCAGKFLFASRLVNAPERVIWDIELPDAAFARELHGFAWLDDLAAAGGSDAEERARIWTQEWIERFGLGPGWSPAQTGQRLLRWINHSAWLISTASEQRSVAFRRSLGHHVDFLSNRWQRMPQGLSRLETLVGLIHAGLVLVDTGSDWEPAIAALAKEADEAIDSAGGVSSRNPEELLEILSLLIWTVAAFADAGKIPPERMLGTVSRIAPTLRTLRHSDGGLARFHGGGRGIEGRLDHALANSGAPRHGRTGLAMGFARLSASRTSLIMDVAPPPATGDPMVGHDSTLAFELTLGRRPLVVNCGSGTSFGTKWDKAGRSKALHSVLEVNEPTASGSGGHRNQSEARNLTAGAPADVRVRQFSGLNGKSVHASHDGYVPTHGMIHIRAVELSFDGGTVRGRDTLTVASDDEIQRFEQIRSKMGRPGIPFSVRFHLHPEVEVKISSNGKSISLQLGSGEIWTFRCRSSVAMSLDSSVYLEQGALAPKETEQIVLTGHASAYVTHVHWSLERDRESPVHIRDLDLNESETAA